MANTKSSIKNLNAPKKMTWMITLFATIAGLITGIIGLMGTAWASIASFILLLGSAVVLLLSCYLKGL